MKSYSGINYDLARLIGRSRILDSRHSVTCALRLHQASCGLPATHPRQVEHLQRSPACDCELSKGGFTPLKMAAL